MSLPKSRVLSNSKGLAATAEFHNNSPEQSTFVNVNVNHSSETQPQPQSQTQSQPQKFRQFRQLSIDRLACQRRIHTQQY